MRQVKGTKEISEMRRIGDVQQRAAKLGVSLAARWAAAARDPLAMMTKQHKSVAFMN